VQHEFADKLTQARAAAAREFEQARALSVFVRLCLLSVFVFVY
jgi:hypothetical protein